MGKKGKINHLLVIRLSAMGDVAMLVPCILAITKAYPSLQITILTRERFRPIFEGMANVSVFEAAVKEQHKGISGLFRLYQQLKKQKIDTVADTHHVLRSNVLKFFFWFSGIPFVQIDKGRKEKKALTRAHNKVFKPLKTTQERYHDVFKELGFDIELNKEMLLPKLAVPQIDFKALQHADKWIGIAPFAAHESKMYPLHLMETVIQKLAEHQEYGILLFGGGAKEVALLRHVEDKLGANVISIAGKVDFRTELALISNLKVMLAMDSGNGHLAANYGVEVVTLWGVTHPYAGFAPFGQPFENSLCANREKYPLIPTSVYGNKFPEGYDKAMESISPEHVYQTIIGILQKQ